ncbi:transferase [Aspergillus floccosus]
MNNIRKDELSDLDRISVPMMVKSFVFYELQRDVDINDLAASVKEGLSNATRQFPFMAGYLQVDESGKLCIMTVPGKHVQCAVKHLDPREHMSFSNLANDSFSPKNLSPALLLPEMPADEKPVCTLQLNFIEGGLILAFTMHHMVGDWASMDTFLSMVCQGAKAHQQGQEMLIYTPDIDKAPYNGTEGLPRQDLLDRLPTYYIAEKAPFDPKPLPPFQTGIYRITESSVQHLKAQCSPYLQGVDYVSSYDCFSALLWISITRARICLHPEKATSLSRLLHPVNVRSRDPESRTSERYFGNGVFPTHAGPMTAQEMVSDGEKGLAAAASLIRQSINSVNLSSIHDLTSLVKSFSATEQLGVHSDFHDMDILMNSWYSRSTDKYDMGGGSLPVAFRTHRPVTGAYCLVLPSLGRKETGVFEVFVQLAAGEHELLRRDEEFFKYFQLVA